MIGPKELKLSGFGGSPPGDVVRSLVQIGLFDNSSQTIRPLMCSNLKGLMEWV